MALYGLRKLSSILIQKVSIIELMLTAKAVTLIFISGRGSAISSARFSFFGEELKSCLGRAKCAFHKNPNHIHTELTFINPQSA